MGVTSNTSWAAKKLGLYSYSVIKDVWKLDSSYTVLPTRCFKFDSSYTVLATRCFKFDNNYTVLPTRCLNIWQ